LTLESDPINPPPAVNPRGQESNDPKVIDLLGGGGKKKTLPEKLLVLFSKKKHTSIY
jgi:hypothetical protein